MKLDILSCVSLPSVYPLQCNAYSGLLSIFFNWIFLMSFKNSLYILDCGPLLEMWFANVLSRFVICLFIFFTCYFTEQMFFTLMRSNISFFFFYGSCLWCQVKEFLPSLEPENFSYAFYFPMAPFIEKAIF